MPLPHPWTSGYDSDGDTNDDDFEDDDESSKGYPITLLPELTMCAASNAIREKPDWWTKFKDPVIAARWKQELLASSREKLQQFWLSEEQVEYVFLELEWYAQQRQDQIDHAVARGRWGEGRGEEVVVPIEVGVDGTRRADGLIPQGLKERLVTCVQKLEDVPQDVPEDEKGWKDWHPGTDNKVLDLVHPSLFPFVANRTLVTREEAIPPLAHIGGGKTKKRAPRVGGLDATFYSKKYQWLPTDFTLTSAVDDNDHEAQEGGTRERLKVKAKSYINNLHPVEHRGMYPVLEEILERFLPMFEQVLGEMESLTSKTPRLTADSYTWYDGQVTPQFGEGDEEAEQEYFRTRVPNPIHIPPFDLAAKNTNRPRAYNLLHQLQQQPLQVIIKLANIELTPSSPTYDGGSWHVEGMANEDIVATGIYYYHSENITESRLNFRVQVREPPYEQNDSQGMLHMYGLENDGALVQYLDGIVTKQDRCIVFPNIFQHQVQPFRLQDPTRPGSRKILVFFLVNPEEGPILSTTFVPPQQKAWSSGTVAAASLNKELAKKLSPEIARDIERLVDWPMTLEEAKKHRELLMKERKYFVTTMNEDVFERPFSLCEH